MKLRSDFLTSSNPAERTQFQLPQQSQSHRTLAVILNHYMDIISYLTKENIAIGISILALGISGFTLLLDRKKFSLDKLNFKREFYLGASKLKEVVDFGTKIQNVDPKNITKDKFENDKLVVNELLSKYYEHEEKITKTSYALPDVIIDIKKTIEKLNFNFAGKSERDVYYSPEIEAIINYGHLFFTFSMLCYPLSISETKDANKEIENQYYKFLKLYSLFNDEKSQIMQEKFDENFEKLRIMSEKLST